MIVLLVLLSVCMSWSSRIRFWKLSCWCCVRSILSYFVFGCCMSRRFVICVWWWKMLLMRSRCFRVSVKGWRRFCVICRCVMKRRCWVVRMLRVGWWKCVKVLMRWCLFVLSLRSVLIVWWMKFFFWRKCMKRRLLNCRCRFSMCRFLWRWMWLSLIFLLCLRIFVCSMRSWLLRICRMLRNGLRVVLLCWLRVLLRILMLCVLLRMRCLRVVVCLRLRFWKLKYVGVWMKCWRSSCRSWRISRMLILVLCRIWLIN